MNSNRPDDTPVLGYATPPPLERRVPWRERKLIATRS